jgi:hypothetical protein
MDSSVSPKDEIRFLRVCRLIPTALHYIENNVQVHASATLIEGTEPKIGRMEQKAVWATEPGSAKWKEEKHLPMQGTYPS